MTGVSSRSTVAPDRFAVDCRIAACDEELEEHFRLRRAVFVHEQGLFDRDDRDERDDRPETLHALGFVDGEPCGAVRLYPLDPNGVQWKGDRLAVLVEHRANHLGAELVRLAVRTAGLLGGETMIAHVQLPNVRFFERLGWNVVADPEPFHGVMHQLMSIGLSPRGAG